MTPRSYTLAETAKVAGLGEDRFRKVWRAWRRDRRFPAPFNTPADGCNYAWDADAVDAWRQARADAFGDDHVAPAAANDVHPFDRSDHHGGARLNRERARLHQLMRGAS